VPVPLPPQAPAEEGYVSFGEGRLWYWDTGGSGQPVVLMHAGSGAGTIWGYQQPVLAAAGYRVIGYSRRGYRNSDPGPATDPGTSTEDLQLLLDHLGVSRVHLVGTAGGSISAAGYALTYPERVRSLALVCSLITIDDADYVARSNALRPAQWSSLPLTFQELGPSYRAADPAGTAAWETESGGSTIRQGTGTPVTAARLAALRVPILLATGDADLYTPPAMLRELAVKIPAAASAIIAESGHSAFWSGRTSSTTWSWASSASTGAPSRSRTPGRARDDDRVDRARSVRDLPAEVVGQQGRPRRRAALRRRGRRPGHRA
jgi:pimeloyl-ACP methyl ester carboxylesterase